MKSKIQRKLEKKKNLTQQEITSTLGPAYQDALSKGDYYEFKYDDQGSTLEVSSFEDEQYRLVKADIFLFAGKYRILPAWFTGKFREIYCVRLRRLRHPYVYSKEP